MRARLAAAADVRFAEGERRFFQNEIDPWGVRTAALQPIARWLYAAVKPLPRAEWNRICEQLWRGRFEEGVLVCHVYRRFARTCGAAEWTLFEHWIDRHVHNWAHCDGVASWLLAACIGNEPALKLHLPSWTASENKWKRRASAVSLLQEAKAGRSTGDILHVAGLLREDGDPMVQKGLGWLLKETYPRMPRPVVELLQSSAYPRLVVRYAAEKMTADDKRAFGLGARR